MNRMRDTFQRLTHVPDYELRGLLPSNNKELSVCAIKNGRRVMEDRHVVVPDVNALFGIVDVSIAFILSIPSCVLHSNINLPFFLRVTNQPVSMPFLMGMQALKRLVMHQYTFIIT